MQREAYPHVRNLFAPRQVCLEDVPKLPFNLSDPAAQLTATNKLRLRRAKLIAPVLLGEQQIPVAPLANPLTGASHHSIVLCDPEDESLKVQLFIDDTNMYFKGFCRGVVTMTADGPQEQWGRCFVFNDKYREMPEFFHPTKMGLRSDHSGKGDAPGPLAMLHMFCTFAKFEEMVEIGADAKGNPAVIELSDQMKRDLEMAVGRAIVVFCEALRLKSLYHVVYRMLRGNEYSAKLTTALWKLIHSWGKLSEEAQSMRKRRKTALDCLLDKAHTIQSRGFVAKTLGDIIGRQGQLKFGKLELNDVISESNKQEREQDHAAINLADPKFDPA